MTNFQTLLENEVVSHKYAHLIRKEFGWVEKAVSFMPTSVIADRAQVLFMKHYETFLAMTSELSPREQSIVAHRALRLIRTSIKNGTTHSNVKPRASLAGARELLGLGK